MVLTLRGGRHVTMTLGRGQRFPGRAWVAGACAVFHIPLHLAGIVPNQVQIPTLDRGNEARSLLDTSRSHMCMHTSVVKSEPVQGC